MPPEAEMVPRQQYSARLGLLDDPYVVVEGLFCSTAGPYASQREELREPVRRLRAAASRRHG
jgi:hypothetical protein